MLKLHEAPCLYFVLGESLGGEKGTDAKFKYLCFMHGFSLYTHDVRCIVYCWRCMHINCKIDAAFCGIVPTSQLCQIQFGGEDEAPPTLHHLRRSVGDKITLPQLQYTLLEQYGQYTVYSSTVYMYMYVPAYCRA